MHIFIPVFSRTKHAVERDESELREERKKREDESGARRRSEKHDRNYDDALKESLG